MGRRGPIPMPAAVKLLRGEDHRDRINFLEPKARLNRPRMPRDLLPGAAVVWRRVMLEQAPGVIRRVDTDLLRIYCEAVARYEAAAALYRQSGPLMAGARGGVVKNPLHQIVRDLADQIRLFGRELGLSPASRAALRIDPHERYDDIADAIGPPPRFRFPGGRA